jgi:hypothetical protein
MIKTKLTIGESRKKLAPAELFNKKGIVEGVIGSSNVIFVDKKGFYHYDKRENKYINKTNKSILTYEDLSSSSKEYSQSVLNPNLPQNRAIIEESRIRAKEKESLKNRVLEVIIKDCSIKVLADFKDVKEARDFAYNYSLKYPEHKGQIHIQEKNKYAKGGTMKGFCYTIGGL